MRATVIGIMTRQHGLITRRQAIGEGLHGDEIDRLVRSGAWTLVRRGVYCNSSVWSALPHWEDRQSIRDRAAMLRIGISHVGSHDTSGHQLGMGLLHPPSPSTHVTRPGVVGSHLRHGVKHHLAPYPDAQVTVANGVRVLGLARTAVDIAREHGHRHGMVAVDSAYRLGATAQDFADVLALMENWPQIRTARRAVADGDDDTDSVAETLGRELVEELGYGRPVTQFGLTADGRVVWCDLVLARHVFEVHGALKFLTPLQGGIADDPPTAVLKDKQRSDWVTGFKMGMSAIYWNDLWGADRARAKERLTREFLDTCNRFGTDRTDLAEYRPRQPRLRPNLPRAS